MTVEKDVEHLKYPKDFVNKIVRGNAFELIKKIPSQSADVVLTDPPYGIGKKGIENSKSLETFYEILPECYRVLKENSFFITFFSTKRLPDLFKNNPFKYLWQFILYCPNGRVRSPIGLTKFMSCFVFKKGNPRLSKLNKDIFVDTPSRMIEPDEGYINHPSPKPKNFIKEILNMLTKENDLVLDPFIGSGSTAVACEILNRNFIGFEINKEYCQIADSRLSKFKIQKYS